MSTFEKEKVYSDVTGFIYKYTHDMALQYPVPDDYVSMSEDMKFSRISLRVEFPVGEHYQGGKKIDRMIYASGKPVGKEISFKYKVSLDGDVEVVYFLDEGYEPDLEDLELYQWVCDQIFLVYGKQPVLDALNIMAKVSQGKRG